MQKRRLPTILSAFVLTGAAGICSILPLTSAFAQYDVTVVMSGLDNPRGLAFGPDGGLYVTEAGRGGTGTTIVSGSGASVSYGTTSAVSRLLGGVQSRVLTGAPSLAPTGGSEATGLQDITFVNGQAFGIIGLGANPLLRSNFSASETGAQFFGNIVRLSLDGSNGIQSVADVSAREVASNPGGDGLDSNPTGIIALGGGGFAVTDAGANALFGVSAAGTVSTLSFVPPRPNPLPFGPPVYQSVPTGIALGPDGAYYFTELTGFPFLPGAANIYRYDPLTSLRTVAYSGFTNLLDLAFSSDGSLYALQLTTNGLAAGPNAGPGVVIRIDTNGNRTIIDNQNLTAPTALAIGQDGALYISNQGSSAGSGQVVRITAAAPEPGALPLIAAGGLLSLVGLARNGVRRRRSNR